MKNIKTILGITLVTSLMMTSCSQTSGSSSEQRSTTESEASFKEVKIGNQIWMTENLNVDKFRNGESIPEMQTVKEWEKAGKEGKPAWCYLMYDPANEKKYGKLYNWYAVNDPRGLAPNGWHVPTEVEWSTLEEFLGVDASNKLKSKSDWGSFDNQTNQTGFSAVPGSFCFGTGRFCPEDGLGTWWSSTEDSPSYIWVRGLSSKDNKVNKGYMGIEDGCSVRCIKD